MSARDKHYKPRRFRDESDGADKKLRGSKSAKKYMVQHDEEYASEPGSGEQSAPEVKIPSRVRVPEDVAISGKRAASTSASRAAARAEILAEAEAAINGAKAEKTAPAVSAEAKPSEAPKVEETKPVSEPEPAEKPEAEKKPDIAEKPGISEAPAERTESEKPESEKPAEEPGKTVPDEKTATEETPGEPEKEEKPEKAKSEHNSSSSRESFDYVVPEKKSKKRRKNKSDTHHSVTPVTPIDEVEADFDEGYVFEEDDNPDNYASLRQAGKKKRKKSKAKVVLLSILCIVLALILGLISTFFIMREIGRQNMLDYKKIEIEAPSTDESGRFIDTLDATGRIINYDGVSYEFNDNIMSVVFIGADNGSEHNEDMVMGDAIYVLAIDVKTGSVKILGISRDTMADVDVYSEAGKFINTEKLQLSYAHAYSGEGVTGGQNTLTSVSRLFYGLPLKNYFSINMDALTTLNDSIGGVTLTSSITFVSPEDGRTINEGETVTLHGAEAERYVRTRSHDSVEANSARMQRQQEYIRAFISSIFPAVKKDISVVSNLYNAIKKNSDSTLDLSKVIYFASTAVSKLNNASDIEYITLNGKAKMGDKYAELYVSNEDTIRTMLDVFYKPVQFTPIKETEK